jgi:hypothetical protein
MLTRARSKKDTKYANGRMTHSDTTSQFQAPIDLNANPQSGSDKTFGKKSLWGKLKYIFSM